MEIGFDVISDLYLTPEDSFNWEGKATSLYCIVAGNISSDYRTILLILKHLSIFYQAVFYTPGTLEYEDVEDITIRTEQLIEGVRRLPNVAMLHQNVVIIDGIAILGANGWSVEKVDEEYIPIADIKKIDDISYLKNSIGKLQKHLDVKKIVVVTNAVPCKELYFSEVPENYNGILELTMALMSDTEKKVTTWIYGTYDKEVETTFNSITYINNSYYDKRPYWAKRLTINI